MVWAIFAPKFAFETCGLCISEGLLLLGVCSAASLEETRVSETRKPTSSRVDVILARVESPRISPDRSSLLRRALGRRENPAFRRFDDPVDTINPSNVDVGSRRVGFVTSCEKTPPRLATRDAAESAPRAGSNHDRSNDETTRIASVASVATATPNRDEETRRGCHRATRAPRADASRTSPAQ